MTSLLYVILYLIGGFATLIFNYYETDSEPVPVDIFLLWPFAAIMILAALVIAGPAFSAHYIAKFLKRKLK